MINKLFQTIRKFTHSLSFKLSFYAGLIMLVALLAFTYHSVKAHKRSSIEKTVKAALNDSEVIKAAIWKGMMTKDRKVIRDIVRSVGKNKRFEDISVYDARGVVYYFSKSHDSDNHVRDHEQEILLKEIGSDESVRYRITSDQRSIDVVNPLLNTKTCSTATCHAHPNSQKVLGALALRIPLDDINSEIYVNARKTILFAFLLFLAISSIIGLAVIFLVNPSLRRLQRKAAELAVGQYAPLVACGPQIGMDEIDELDRSFDDMSRKVQARTTELAEGRRLYKSLFEEAPCYLTVVSPDYRLVRGNRVFRETFGDQMGKHCYVGYKGREGRCDECPVEKTFADGQSHQSEETWSLAKGEAHVLVKTAPIYDREGRIAEVLEMSLDVTRLKRLQIEVQKKHQEYKQLFENVPCYLTVVDRDFCIVQANGLFERDFGKAIGRRCFRAYKKRDSKCENCSVEQTFVDGQDHQSEEVWNRNGEEMHIVVHTAPLMDEKGNIVAVMEMSANITEVKRLQQELVTLGETIAGMSHTIKNILSGLQGGVYVLDSGLQKKREDRVQDGWNMVKKNVEKISELVNGILYASKERQPEYRECAPSQLLEEVCGLFEEKARSHSVELIRDFDPEMSSVRIDPAGIHSVLSNLMSNALEACRTSGKPQCSVTVTGRIAAERLIMEVADDGPGIPAEVRERLFTKFYSTKGSKGTGLGLVITKKVVREHQGTIRVESEPGRGTKFIIELPILPQDCSSDSHGLKAAV